MRDKKTFKMQLEVDSPLHIGGVEYKTRLKKADYVLSNGKIHVIDGEKLTALLLEKKLFEIYLDYVDKNAKRMNISFFLNDYGLFSSLKSISKNIIDLEEGGAKNERVNDILLFVRNAGGQYYIPGSSIKGAMMHLLLLAQIAVHYQELEGLRKEILRLCKSCTQPSSKNFHELRRNVSKRIIDRLEPYIYQVRQKGGKKTKHAGVSVSDSYGVENLDYSIRQDVDASRIEEGKITHMPLGREYVLPGTKFFFDLTLDFDILKNLNIECLEDFLYLCEKSCVAMGEALGIQDNYDMILGSNTGFLQKTVLHALFADKRERQEVIKKILHKPTSDSRRKKQSEHINDKISPRVKNLVYSQDGYHSMAGFVYLSERA